ncbi:MAG: InlB B-repeat-containing protein, partial [Wujia sp.]
MNKKGRQMCKRTFSIVLTFCLILSVLAFGELPALGELSGSSITAEAAVTQSGQNALNDTSDGYTGEITQDQLTPGYTMTEGYVYHIKSGRTITGSSSSSNGYSRNGLNVASGKTVVMIIDPGVTLTVNGQSGSASTPGGAGIYVPSNSTLIITGGGTLNATGGASGKGSNGSYGGDWYASGTDYGNYRNLYFYTGYGGSGGAGAGGPGAGIGGSGGSGGSGGGGTSRVSRYMDGGFYDMMGYSGGSGGNGYAGTTMGSVYVLGSVTVNATAGTRYTTGGSGGWQGQSKAFVSRDLGQYENLGGGGGGGGGGYAGTASAIGGGGAGGGGGSGGGSGGFWWIGLSSGAQFYPGNPGVGGSPGGGGGYKYYSYVVRDGYTNGGSYYYPCSVNWYYTSRGGNAGSAGYQGSRGGNGYLYVAPTASVTGGTKSGSVSTHSRVQYPIAFDTNVTDSSITDYGTQYQKVTYYTMPSSVTVPKRTGYDFAGYYTSDNAGDMVFDKDGKALANISGYTDGNKRWIRNQDTILYAHWTPSSYIVNLDNNGGKGTSSITLTYTKTIEEVKPQITPPTKVGGVFQGYYYGNEQYYDSNGSAVAGKTYDFPYSITLKAQWESLDYTVELYSDGQYIKEMDLTYGQFQLPGAQDLGISKTHYDFIGWNLYSGQDWAMYAPNTIINGGITDKAGATVTLYAAWALQDSYSVTYNANGGVGTPAITTGFPQEDLIITDVAPTKENYTFVGWNTSADGSGTMYQPGAVVASGFGENTTLYAIWKRNPSLSYHANGGVFDYMSEKAYHQIGEEVSIDYTNLPTRNGYDFDGWNTKSDGSGNMYRQEDGRKLTIADSDVVLYAQWKKQSMAVQYTVNQYGVVEGASSVLYGDTLEFTVTIPAYADATGMEVTANEVVLRSPGMEAGENGSTVYTYTVKNVKEKQYINVGGIEAMKYGVTFDTQGGKIETDITGYSYGQVTTLPDAAVVTKTGYTFGGWYEQSDATQTVVTEISATQTGKKTYVAKWTANTYTIKLNANGGSTTAEGWITEGGKQVKSIEATYDYPGGYTLPTVTELTGETIGAAPVELLGWATEANATAPKYQPGSVVNNLATGNTSNAASEDPEQGENQGIDDSVVTLYAVWDLPSYTVVYDSNGGKFESTNTSGQTVYSNTASDTFRHGTDAELRFGSYAPKRDGYAFLGWDEDLMAQTATYREGNTIQNIRENKSVYAVWAPSYTVNYKTGVNETIKEQQLKEDGTVEEVEREQEIVFSDIAVKNQEYTIAQLPDKSALQGKILLGWATSETNKEAKKIAYHTGDVVQNLGGAQDTTLYAVWAEADTKYLSFDLNGGAWTGDGFAPVAASEGNFDISSLPDQSALTKEGYNFADWTTTKDDEGTKVTQSSVIAATTNTTLYALWKKGSYIIEYCMTGPVTEQDENTKALTRKDVNGTLQKDTVTYGTSHNLYDGGGYTCGGYTLIGWSNSENAEIPDYQKGQSVTDLAGTCEMDGNSVKTKTKKLYPIWEKTGYTITYDANKPAASSNEPTGTMSGTAATYNTPVALADNQYQLTDYTFLGWAKEKDASEPLYQNKQTVIDLAEEISIVDVEGLSSIRGDKVTLYAVWAKDDAVGSYTIQYNANYGDEVGTGGSMENQAVQCNKYVPLSTNEFTWENHTFLGWATSQENSSGDNVQIVYRDKAEVKDLAEKNGSITLYAVWSETNEKTTHLSFDANGGTFTGGQPQEILQTIEATATDVSYAITTLPTDIKRDGYTFAGWSTAENATVPNVYETMTVKAVTSPSEENIENTVIVTSNDLNVTLHAVWIMNAAFDANGGYFKVGQPTRVQGTFTQEDNVCKLTYDVSSIDNVVRPGYTFVGWSLSSSAKVADTVIEKTYTNPVEITAPTIYAVWSKDTVLNYDANGGSWKTSQPEAVKGSVLTATEGQIGTYQITYDLSDLPTDEAFNERSGYTFLGWSTNRDASEPDTFTDNQYIKTYGASESNYTDVTLYAVWKTEEYKIVFHKNVSDPESEEDIQTQSLANDNQVALMANPFTREDFVFLGWSDDKDSSNVSYINQQKVYNLYSRYGKNVGSEADADKIHLYAVWKSDKTCYLTYDANGGQYAPAAGSYEYEEQVTLDATVVPSWENHIFLGWSTSSTATEATYVYNPAVDGEVLTPASFAPGSFAITDTMTLYAVWKEEPTYSVTYESNGGSDMVPVNNRVYKTGDIVEIDFMTVPTKTGYLFGGWKCQDTTYTDGDGQTLTIADADLTLEAQWNAIQYEIVYHNGEYTLGTDSVTYGDEVQIKDNTNTDFTNPVVVDGGHEFTGWALSDGGSVVYGPGVIVTNLTTVNDAVIDLYMVLAPKSVTVTLADETTIEVTYGEQMPIAPTPTKEGYRFEGYYVGTKQYYDAQMNSMCISDLTSDTILTAKWTALDFDIMYMKDGGIVATQTTDYDAQCQIKSLQQLGIALDSEYIFEGWALTKEKADVGDYDYPAGQVEAKKLWNQGEARSLYAVIRKNVNYKVTYYGDGASNVPVDTTEYKNKATVTVNTTNLPIKEGYTFLGWATKAQPTAEDVVYAAGAEDATFTITSNVTLYAVWKAN